jgi:biopolymer transport protein ExbD
MIPSVSAQRGFRTLHLSAILLIGAALVAFTGCSKDNDATPEAKPGATKDTGAAAGDTSVGAPTPAASPAAAVEPAGTGLRRSTPPKGANVIEIRLAEQGRTVVRVDGKIMMDSIEGGRPPTPSMMNALEDLLRMRRDKATDTPPTDPRRLFYLECDPEVNRDLVMEVIAACSNAGLQPDPIYRGNGELLCRVADEREIAEWVRHISFGSMPRSLRSRIGDSEASGSPPPYTISLQHVDPVNDTTENEVDVFLDEEPVTSIAELSDHLETLAGALRKDGQNPAEIPAILKPDMIVQYRHVVAANKAAIDAGFKWIYVSIAY